MIQDQVRLPTPKKYIRMILKDFYESQSEIHDQICLPTSEHDLLWRINSILLQPHSSHNSNYLQSKIEQFSTSQPKSVISNLSNQLWTSRFFQAISLLLQSSLSFWIRVEGCSGKSISMEISVEVQVEKSKEVWWKDLEWCVMPRYFCAVLILHMI